MLHIVIFMCISGHYCSLKVLIRAVGFAKICFLSFAHTQHCQTETMPLKTELLLTELRITVFERKGEEVKASLKVQGFM